MTCHLDFEKSIPMHLKSSELKSFGSMPHDLVAWREMHVWAGHTESLWDFRLFVEHMPPSAFHLKVHAVSLGAGSSKTFIGGGDFYSPFVPTKPLTL